MKKPASSEPATVSLTVASGAHGALCESDQVAGERLEAHPEDDDDQGAFSICMGFAAAPCPGCGLVTAAGPCPDCGAEVPPPEELSEATQVRRDALLPSRKAAEELSAGFDAVARGTIPITATAMVSGFVEAALFSKALEVTGLGRELGQFDLDDPEAIRGPVRELVEARLDAVKRSLEACGVSGQRLDHPPFSPAAGGRRGERN